MSFQNFPKKKGSESSHKRRGVGNIREVVLKKMVSLTGCILLLQFLKNPGKKTLLKNLEKKMENFIHISPKISVKGSGPMDL